MRASGDAFGGQANVGDVMAGGSTAGAGGDAYAGGGGAGGDAGMWGSNNGEDGYVTGESFASAASQIDTSAFK